MDMKVQRILEGIKAAYERNKEYAEKVELNLKNAKKEAEGIQFIAIQSSPEVESFTGFWMLKDMD